MNDLNNPRTDHDLSHFVFDCGEIGRVKTLSFSLVLPGDSIDIDALGVIRLSPLRRGLTVDSKVDLVSFYVPYRQIFGDKWIEFVKKGQSATLDNVTEPSIGGEFAANYLGFNNAANGKVPKWLSRAFANIYNNYYKVPTDEDNVMDPATMALSTAKYGPKACHLESIWSAPLPHDSNTAYKMSLSDGNTTLDVMKLKAEFAKLNTEQERDFFMTRYRDIVKQFGGYVDTDADNRPTMLMRTEFWASGYDVDGTGQTTLGQFSGRVQQSWRHSVPRFFVPEHGVIMTLILVRFPPIHSYERPYFTGRDSLTYLDFAGDPSLVANQPPVTVTQKDFIANSSSSTYFKIPHSQWFRYHPNFVHNQYTELSGFPFLNKPLNTTYSSTYTGQSYIDPDDYNDMFETTQLAHWNVQCKFNVHVDRNLPTARESIMTSN